MATDDAPARTDVLHCTTVPLDLAAPVGFRLLVVTPATPAVSDAIAVNGTVAVSARTDIVVGMMFVLLVVDMTDELGAAMTTTLVEMA